MLLILLEDIDVDGGNDYEVIDDGDKLVEFLFLNLARVVFNTRST